MGGRRKKWFSPTTTTTPRHFINIVCYKWFIVFVLKKKEQEKTHMVKIRKRSI